MPARRMVRYPVRRINRPVRRTIWNTAILSAPGTVLSGAQITPVDVLSGLEVGGVGIAGGTIVRTHVRVNFSGTAADTQPGMVWSLIVWDKTAAATPPSLIADFYNPWLIYQYCVPSSHGPISNAATTIFYSDEADILAKRRLSQMNDTLLLQMYNPGSQSVKFSYIVRTLIALH
jgi:hypothetical protein